MTTETIETTETAEKLSITFVSDFVVVPPGSVVFLVPSLKKQSLLLITN